jgi:hypothetical protein
MTLDTQHSHTQNSNIQHNDTSITILSMVTHIDNQNNATNITILNRTTHL